MGITLFLREYFVWHYGKALADMVALTKNFLYFGYHFFSIGLFTRTWMSPWYRMHEGHNRDLTDLESIGATIVANTILRLIGFILKTFVIALGILFESFVIVSAVSIAIAWVFFPLVIFFSLVGTVRVL